MEQERYSSGGYGWELLGYFPVRHSHLNSTLFLIVGGGEGGIGGGGGGGGGLGEGEGGGPGSGGGGYGEGGGGEGDGVPGGLGGLGGRDGGGGGAGNGGGGGGGGDAGDAGGNCEIVVLVMHSMSNQVPLRRRKRISISFSTTQLLFCLSLSYIH